jgi:para-aminobenzoate synthetase component 1
MDLSIAIRTATIIDGQILFSVGGGIVQDSDPPSEFDETLHKGRTLMEVFKGDPAPPSQASYVWQNGQIKPMRQATVSVADPGVQYGFGFFETLRVDAGLPHNLAAHITRFNHAWRKLFATDPPDLTWDVVIEQIVSKNRLQHHTAAVKIMAAKGRHDKRPRAVNLFVLARPYTPRLEGKSEYGLHLATYAEARQTPLARHKTMNYLFYHMAGQWARSQGFDEALILNPDGTISETNSANLLMIKGKRAVQPFSPHVLPGTMEKLVCDLLAGWNFDVTMRPLTSQELVNEGEILVMNSLMGVLPVLSVDGKQLKAPTELCQRINAKIF